MQVQNKNFLYFLIILILYALSGLTAIAYEVLWARYVSMQFGASIFAVVVTVAAFMFGLGFGSYSGSRWLARFKHQLLVFALLESAIALFALSMPVVALLIIILLNSKSIVGERTLSLPMNIACIATFLFSLIMGYFGVEGLLGLF